MATWCPGIRVNRLKPFHENVPTIFPLQLLDTVEVDSPDLLTEAMELDFPSLLEMPANLL